MTEVFISKTFTINEIKNTELCKPCECSKIFSICFGRSPTYGMEADNIFCRSALTKPELRKLVRKGEVMHHVFMQHVKERLQTPGALDAMPERAVLHVFGPGNSSWVDENRRKYFWRTRQLAIEILRGTGASRSKN